MSEQRGSERMLASVMAGVVIGVVEVAFAVAFAATGVRRLPGALSSPRASASTSWRRRSRSRSSRGGPAPRRGRRPPGNGAALIAVVATTVPWTRGSPQRGSTPSSQRDGRDGAGGHTFLVIGSLKRGNLIRFVPYPVVGGLHRRRRVAPAEGRHRVASRVRSALRHDRRPGRTGGARALGPRARLRCDPATRRPVGEAAVVHSDRARDRARGVRDRRARHGSSIGRREGGVAARTVPIGRSVADVDAARASAAPTGSRCSSQWAGIRPRCSSPRSDRCSTSAGPRSSWTGIWTRTGSSATPVLLNVVSGALGGIPGYHALSLTALARADGRERAGRGLVAAVVPRVAVVFGATVDRADPADDRRRGARVPRPGVHRRVGLGQARVLPTARVRGRAGDPGGDHRQGFLPGVVVGLVLAVVLFAVNYGRIELVREVAFGETYRTNVDRPPAERAALRLMGERVQILRVNGFVFFGSANRLLERIRKRVEAAPPRFLVIDLRRVTGVDSSAVVALVKVIQPGRGERVRDGADRCVRTRAQAARTRRGRARGRVVWFEPDLDRGLQRCEDALLGGAAGRGGGGLAEPTRSTVCRRACGRTSSASRWRRGRS